MTVLLACSSASGPAPAPDAGPAIADAGSGPPATATPSPCAGARWFEGAAGWELICDDEPGGHFLSVGGCAADDVYFVGGVPSAPGAPGRTVVWHWDGERIEALATPGTERAWWVFCLDADHVYVVGERGLGLRRLRGDPFEPFDTGTEQTLFGIWGPSADLLFAAGANHDDPAGKGTVHRFAPSGATLIADPVLDAYPGKGLFKVWGSAADDVFVGGELGVIFHYDGQSWSRMDTPDDDTPIVTLFGRGGGEIYGVGGRGHGVIWRYDGADWTDESPEGDFPGLMGVHTSSGAPVLVAGEDGFLATFAGGTLYPAGSGTFRPLHSVWRDGEGGAWAVGGNFNSPRTSEALGVITRKRGFATTCAADAVRGPGFHHLELQGRAGAPRPNGTYPMFDVPRGRPHADLVHGEHFLPGAGSFTEFTMPLCGDITDEIGLRMPDSDDDGAQAMYQLFVVRGADEILVAEALDEDQGNRGRRPFVRSSLPEAERLAIAQTNTSPAGVRHGWAEFADAPPFAHPPQDIFARPGDTLLLRVTNTAEPVYGLMVWFPQAGLVFQPFVEVHVPVSPGGQRGQPLPPAPEPGPCVAETPDRFVALGGGETEFVPFPPNEGPVVWGPQGSLMFLLALRGKGFSAGTRSDPLGPDSPYLVMRLALDGYPDSGGRLVADGTWRRPFERSGEHLVLTNLQPTVPDGAAWTNDLIGHTIYADTKLVDAPTGDTLCNQTTFTGVEP